MKVITLNSYDAISETAANHLLEKVSEREDCSLGLATGGTPQGMYKAIIKKSRAKNISFKQVKTFNLDEYVGLDESNPQSYAFYMKKYFFNEIDIQNENTFLPNGTASDLKLECQRYEKKIEQVDGVDIQVLGIGRNGHIGFNEPNDYFEAKTHVVELDERTIIDNSRYFKSIEEVPKRAISMGVKTILSAKKIVLIAYGIEKSDALYAMIHGPITPKCPASILQLHNNVVVICDDAAASKIILDRKGLTL